jgi:hypothetical protein
VADSLLNNLTYQTTGSDDSLRLRTGAIGKIRQLEVVVSSRIPDGDIIAFPNTLPRFRRACPETPASKNPRIPV